MSRVTLIGKPGCHLCDDARAVTAVSGQVLITLLGKPGCHLCDDARAALERVRAKATFSLREVDITSDDSLHRRYLERIPVIALDGRELFDFFVDESALRTALSSPGP